MQIDKFTWNAPSDDPLWHQLVHRSMETKLNSNVMARIVDVPVALSALQPPTELSGTAILTIADEHAPWNQGSWRVEIDGGSLTAAPTTAEPGVSMDIQSLSQAYLGSTTTSALREADRIHVSDERAYSLLESLFAGPPAWCNDGF